MKQNQRHPAAAIASALRLLALLAILPLLISHADAQFSIIDVRTDIDNGSISDEDGHTPGFIVIENTSSNTRNLFGYHLTDDAAVPTKWTFEANYILNPGNSLLVFTSGKNRDGVPPGDQFPPHTNFADPCDYFTQLREPGGDIIDQVSGTSDKCGLTSSCGPEDTVLVGVDHAAQWWVPIDDKDDTTWFNVGFNAPTQNPPGQNCFGFDIDPLCAGLVLYAPLDNGDVSPPGAGVTVFDRSDSASIHNGIMVPSSHPIVPAQINEGLRMLPQQELQTCVVFDNSAELEPGTGEFTVGVWSRPFSHDGIQILAAKRIQQGPGWILYLDGNNLAFRIFTPTGAIADEMGAELPVAPGTWFHAMATVCIDEGGDRFMNLYIDGVLVNQKQIDPALYIGTSEANLLLGCGTQGTNPFTGDLDDFAIWCACLSDADVAGIYNEGKANRSFKDSCQNNTLYGHLIETNTASQMLKRNCTLYTRYEFSLNTVPATNLIEYLRLCINYEDGFIAYLNGTEVASVNASSNAWNSCAKADRPDPDALNVEVIDITGFASLLRSGQNVLAIHAQNDRPENGRFLLCAELCMKEIQIPDCSKDTLGDDFWLAFPENFPADSGNPLELSICLTAPYTQTLGPPTFASATIDIPGLNLPGWPKTVLINQSLSSGGGQFACREIAIPAEAQLSGSDVIEGKGIHITATTEIAAYGFNKLDYSSDSYLGLPTDCVGRNYIIPCYKNTVNTSSGLGAVNGSQFAIVATQDDTRVRILLPYATSPHAANAVYEILLQQGETYQLRNTDVPPADLSGTRIMATKPVGVFGGHRFALAPSSSYFFADHMVEQILPINAWGSSYMSAPLSTATGSAPSYTRSQFLRVLAAKDNTRVTIIPTSGTITDSTGASFAGTSIHILDAGETYDFHTASACVVTAGDIIQVSQVSPSADYDGSTNADPFLIALQPRDGWKNNYTLCRPDPADWPEQRLGIVVATSNSTANININGSNFLISTPVTGASALYGNIDLSALGSAARCLRITTDSPFALTSYGYDEFEGYGNTGGMAWDDVPPEVVTPLQITHRCDSLNAQGVCTFPTPDILALANWGDNCTPFSLLSASQNPTTGTLLTGPGDHIVTVTVTDTIFGGTGIGQTIVTLLPPFEEEFFPAPAVYEPFVDSDCDGVINLIEKVNGTDPFDPDHDPGFGHYFEEDAGTTYARFRLRRPIYTNGDTIQIMRSTTLPGGFAPVVSGLQELTTLRQLVEGGQFIEYHYRLPIDLLQPKPRAFYTIEFEDN